MIRFALGVVAVLLAQVAAVAQSGPLVLTEDGISGLTARTPFDENTIRRLFPGLDVVTVHGESEGTMFPILSVRRADKLLFDVHPKKQAKSVGGLVVLDAEIRDTRSVTLGKTFAAVYGGARASCAAGTGELTGTVNCLAPNTRILSYRFEGAGADGGVPDDSVLQDWVVSAICWIPRR